MNTLFDLPVANPKHPAKYTDALLSAFVRMLKGCNSVLDPFGGTGKIFLLKHWYPQMNIQAIELEPEWARIGGSTIGNALYLPFADGSFDAVCTSPTYGNAMAKNNHPELWSKPWVTFTYKTSLKRDLSVENSGRLLWGKQYRDFHVKAWFESRRVLRAGGLFVLNIKNHILKGKEQPVTGWHIETLQSLGFKLLEHQTIKTPSMRKGTSAEKRIEFESVIKFRKKL